MGGIPINPVLRGLTTAFGLADMMKRQALNEERARRDEARAAREQETGDLNLAMGMAERGIRPMSDEDLLNRETKQRMIRRRGKNGLPQTELVPDDNRYVKFRGQDYVIPGEYERSERAKQQRELEREEKVKDARAAGDVTIDQKKRELEEIQIPVEGLGMVPLQALNALAQLQGTKVRGEQAIAATEMKGRQDEAKRTFDETQKEKDRKSAEKVAATRASATVTAAKLRKGANSGAAESAGDRAARRKLDQQAQDTEKAMRRLERYMKIEDGKSFVYTDKNGKSTTTKMTEELGQELHGRFSDLEKELDSIYARRKQMDAATKDAGSGTAGVSEGTIIRNQTTGERRQWKGGKWVTLQ